MTYVGVTNNPRRRAAEHRRSGKRGSMRVETDRRAAGSARSWEARRLAGIRRRNRGRNPPHNKTRTGGWRY
ncbi:MAG: hypothetical protein OXH86_15900 [Acidimicrobiaceae bacterium]|nr:hypothetical protein [Acidimicrobiaceae bacterium]